MDQRRQAGPMPWALHCQAPGLESWAGSAEAEGDSGHLRMVKQGVLVRGWVSVSLCLADLSTVGREAQPSTHISDQHSQAITGHNFLSPLANRHELKGKLKPFEGHPVWRVLMVTATP